MPIEIVTSNPTIQIGSEIVGYIKPETGIPKSDLSNELQSEITHSNISTLDKLIEISEGYGLAYTGAEIYALYNSGKHLSYRGQFINDCFKDSSYCYFRAYSDQLVMDYYTPATTTYKVVLNAKYVQSQSQSRGVAAVEFNAHRDNYNRHVANSDYHVNATKQATWNGKYTKPSAGIPSTDMTSEVQTSLSKADTAIQSTDYANASTGGVIKTNSNYDLTCDNGDLKGITSTYSTYQSRSNEAVISKGTLENVIVGKDLANKAYVTTVINSLDATEVSY